MFTCPTFLYTLKPLSISACPWLRVKMKWETSAIAGNLLISKRYSSRQYWSRSNSDVETFAAVFNISGYSTRAWSQVECVNNFLSANHVRRCLSRFFRSGCVSSHHRLGWTRPHSLLLKSTWDFILWWQPSAWTAGTPSWICWLCFYPQDPFWVKRWDLLQWKTPLWHPLLEAGQVCLNI